MTPAAAVAIGLSAVLGLLVSLSTFLVIGATSSLSYNVIGHIKVPASTPGCPGSCRERPSEHVC
jgi:solute carrier family 35, member E3